MRMRKLFTKEKAKNLDICIIQTIFAVYNTNGYEDT